MLKKSLIAIAILAIAMPAFAGKGKKHSWAIEFKGEKVASIDVKADVGWWWELKKEDPITVVQDEGANKFYGCFGSARPIKTNFEAKFKTQFVDTVTGKWSGTVTPNPIPAGKTDIMLCVSGKDVDLTKLSGGSKQRVTTCNLMIMPVDSTHNVAFTPK